MIGGIRIGDSPWPVNKSSAVSPPSWPPMGPATADLWERARRGRPKTLPLYRGVLTQLIEEHQGRVIGTAGDSVLAEFGSAVQAVRSAVAVQRALERRNADLEEGRRMAFRIGINVGDVMVQGGDLLGDGVNI